jgi:hypothetical membrane protein
MFGLSGIGLITKLKTQLTKPLSIVGIVGPLFYIALLTVLGILWQGYSPIKQFMSELGAAGSPYSTVMQFGGFSLLGLVWIAFSLLLFLELKRTWVTSIGIGLIFLSAIAMFAVGFFRCDALCVNVTSEAIMHSMLATLSNISFVFGMLVLHFQIRKDKRFSKNLVTLLLFMAIVANVLSPLIILPQLESVTGLVQRVGIYIPLIWTMIISYTFYAQSLASNSTTKEDVATDDK